MGEYRLCTKILEFDAAHRVLEHGGKCRHLHGHRYRVDVTCGAERLDSLGMVIDFGLIKRVFGGWLEAELDHNTVLSVSDPLLEILLQKEERRPYVLEGNPTAENLAQDLFIMARSLLTIYGIRVVKVRVWETPTCFADYSAAEEGVGD